MKITRCDREDADCYGGTTIIGSPARLTNYLKSSGHRHAAGAPKSAFLSWSDKRGPPLPVAVKQPLLFVKMLDVNRKARRFAILEVEKEV
jgi:hypothetical protein